MTGEREAEFERLASIADDSWYACGSNAASILHRTALLRRFWKGQRCLELGPAEGLMTSALAEAFADLTLVDGSERFCADLRAQFPAVTVVCSLFEEFKPSAPFDTIILGHVLEHVADPKALLIASREWLAPEGVICMTVPNAMSIHRQAAVLMGLLADVHELNETDLHHGHRRVYDPESFRADISEAGLRLTEFGGYWLKPLSMAQIDRDWSAEMLAAFMTLGERYPDVAAELYAIAGA
jgi:2-polyprenyl-3-methyl-5-hydroxy-6-metoxy-1,4-benzoquinol methylase